MSFRLTSLYVAVYDARVHSPSHAPSVQNNLIRNWFEGVELKFTFPYLQYIGLCMTDGSTRSSLLGSSQSLLDFTVR